MKRGIITGIIVIVVIALIAWVLISNKKENEAKTAIVAEDIGTVLVKTVVAKKESIDLDFTSNGNFAAKQDLDLLAETSGRVTQIMVKEGSKVSKGQVLIKIDPEYASLDLQNAEVAYQKLKTDMARYQSSFETGGVTRAQLDEITFNLKNAENRVQQAKRRVQDSYINAPISGVVNQRAIELGAYVSPGTLLFNLVDISTLKLQVSANESQVVNIHLGDEVAISTSVFPDKEFSGKVTFIASKADNTLNYPVEIEVSNPEPNTIRAGMYATATFKFPKQQAQITVPRSAFVGGVSSNQLFVLENGNTAKLKTVVSGRVVGEQVEIVSGLNEGEVVITSGQINLVDGTQVSPQK